MSSKIIWTNFKYNQLLWKIFGIWPGVSFNKYYKYYSIAYVAFTLLTYNVLLTLNLIYTPRQLEFIIKEVIFLFTEVVVTSKALTILVMKDKIKGLLDKLDDDLSKRNDKDQAIILKYYGYYLNILKFFFIVSNVSYCSHVFAPLFLHFFSNQELELPICQYYFLSDGVRAKFFAFIYVYQSVGMYGHLIYNVSTDSFIAGALIMAIAQVKVLQGNLTALKEDPRNESDANLLEEVQMNELKECLKSYEFTLQYCSEMQDIFNVIIFTQFGFSSLIICITLCGCLLPVSTEIIISMIAYLMAMSLQIFVPGWLGTTLYIESHELIVSAYDNDWIKRSVPFRRSLIIFVERANKPITISGLKLFTLSLQTFTSIIKTAYSFFTLVRTVNDA